MRHVDVAARRRRRTVGLHVDPLQMDAGAVDDELRVEVRRHRDELLNGHDAASERRGTVRIRGVANGDVEIWTDNPPRRVVIFEGELPALRAKPPERHGKGPRSARLLIVACEPGKVVAAVPSLDEHLPVGHLHRGDGDVRLARERRQPVETDVDPLRGEERSIAFAQPVDRQVFDDHSAGDEMNLQRADVQRPFDGARPGVFGASAHDRTEIDSERRNDRRGQQCGDHPDRDAGRPEDDVPPQTREDGH